MFPFLNSDYDKEVGVVYSMAKTLVTPQLTIK